VRLARELKVSPKRLTGWEPTERITVTARDSRGRPSVFHVEREPEWDDEQVALLLALDETEEEIGPHGIPMAEATSPLADPSNRFVGWHYEVPPPKIDHAQRALNVEQDRRREAYPEEDAASLLWTLTRVEDGPQTPVQQ
jgi:hypothetical protein